MALRLSLTPVVHDNDDEDCTAFKPSRRRCCASRKRRIRTWLLVCHRPPFLSATYDGDGTNEDAGEDERTDRMNNE